MESHLHFPMKQFFYAHKDLSYISVEGIVVFLIIESMDTSHYRIKPNQRVLNNGFKLCITCLKPHQLPTQNCMSCLPTKPAKERPKYPTLPPPTENKSPKPFMSFFTPNQNNRGGGGGGREDIASSPRSCSSSSTCSSRSMSNNF